MALKSIFWWESSRASARWHLRTRRENLQRRNKKQLACTSFHVFQAFTWKQKLSTRISFTQVWRTFRLTSQQFSVWEYSHLHKKPHWHESQTPPGQVVSHLLFSKLHGSKLYEALYECLCPGLGGESFPLSPPRQLPIRLSQHRAMGVEGRRLPSSPSPRYQTIHAWSQVATCCVDGCLRLFCHGWLKVVSS